MQLGRPGPVAQLVSAPPCHGGGRGFESRRGRESGERHKLSPPLARTACRGGRPGSSVGSSVRLKSERAPVGFRPWPHFSAGVFPCQWPASTAYVRPESSPGLMSTAGGGG